MPYKNKKRATTRAGRAAEKGTRPHGGAREGGGRKSTMEEALTLLNRMSTVDDERATEILERLKKSRFRIPAGADESIEEFVAWCRAKLMQIVINPTRHAQAQTQILKMFLEEACGKVAENHNVEQAVTVKIVKSATPAAAPPATDGEPEVHAPVLPFPIVTSRESEN